MSFHYGTSLNLRSLNRSASIAIPKMTFPMHLKASASKKDTIFTYQSLRRLGLPDGKQSIDRASAYLQEAITEMLGDQGTLHVPSYTYCIGRHEVYDVNETPFTVGPFTEFFRTIPAAIRSKDPMPAMSGTGPEAKKYLTNLPQTVFGNDSVYDRISHSKTWVVMIALDLYFETYRRNRIANCQHQ